MAARTSWAMLSMPVTESVKPDEKPIRLDPQSDLAKRITARYVAPETRRLKRSA